jgi:hypothetical protein
MREVKLEDGIFVDSETDKGLKCCFDKNHFINSCNTECVACEINQDGMRRVVTCLRGSFAFASIVE